MLRKPDSCKECPLYGDGRGYVPDEIHPSSQVLIVMQAPGSTEEQQGRPACGVTGEIMNDQFIPLTGLTRGANVSVANVLKCRWYDPSKGQKTDELPPRTILDKAAHHCLRHHFSVPSSVTHIIAQGGLSARHLGGVQEDIHDWRGFITPHTYEGRPVYAVLHIAGLRHEPRMNVPSYGDWAKFRQILDGEWPQALPDRIIAGQQEHSAILQRLLHECDFITVDGEWPYVGEWGNQPLLTLLGVAGRSKTDGQIIGVQFPWKQQWRDDVRQLLLGSNRVVFHNGMADIPVIERYCGISYRDYHHVGDTMLQHAVLWSEWPHNLGFLESLFSPYHKMKHLSDTDHLLYNWGDVLTTLHSYEAMNEKLKNDPGSYAVYHDLMLPLFDVRLAAKEHGVPIDTQFLADYYPTLAEKVAAAQSVGETYAGYPINIGSAGQLIQWFQHAEHTVKLTKGKKTKSLSMDDDHVATYRRTFYDFDPEEEKDGIHEEMLSRNIDAGGHPLLEARAAYQAADQLRTHYLVPLLHPTTCREDGKERIVYQPDDFVSVVYPDQNIHAQVTGRWSTVDPPLPTLPKRLRGMVTTWEGWTIIKFDWDQIELRISAHLANDRPTLEAFANGWDIHTMNACDCFGMPYPPNLKDPHNSEECEEWRTKLGWEGKDDRRRVFAKRFVYRIIYRGNPRFAGDIPGAVALGLTPTRLVSASRSYLARHPALPVYWNRIDEQVKRTRIVRTFYGRRRVLNGSLKGGGYGNTSEVFREGSNHPMQGGVADVFNKTVIRIYEETRDIGSRWLYGAHDSQVWTVPNDVCGEMESRIARITNEPWEIDGRQLVLPVTIDPQIPGRSKLTA